MMIQLFEEFIERPLMTFISSVEILIEGFEGKQTIDGFFSRIIHSMSCPPKREQQGNRDASTKTRAAEESEKDQPREI